MRSIELLCPARNKDCAIAAIDNGADAVYIGAERFGARAAAGNSVEDIREVVEYAHHFGVKVDVTLNTLLYDDEVQKAVDLAWELNDIGVDAFIIQDPRLYKRLLGKVHLHSSTQMDNRDAATVLLRQQQGFEQTVLARELTIDEIAEIHKSVPEMPLEVFIHGAICVCYNGRCFASEVCYGRSANRGECAQFCRMPFTLETHRQPLSTNSSQRMGEETIDDRGNFSPPLGGDRGRAFYPLSMRDMNRTRDLEALLDAGVTSFKIEGRLKDAMYVKNVTAWYRQHLDAIFRRRPEYRRSSFGKETFFFTPDVDRTFNRGYTDYFMHGRTSDLCSLSTPKSIGQYVGYVKEIRRDHIVVAGTAVFANGDGIIALSAQSSSSIGFRVNRAENNHLYPYRMPHGLRDGMKLYRNQDEAMERILSGRTAVRKLPLSWTLSATEKGFLLSATVYDRVVSKEFEYPHQPAQKNQTQSHTDVLSKLGDTIYETERIEVPGEYFIPRSILTEWRRQVLKEQSNCPLTPIPIPLERGRGVLTSDDELLHTVLSTPSALLGEEGRRSLGAGEPQTLMTCRYCIRYQIGQCLVRNQGAVRGPLYLRGSDGKRFLLKFDCKKCQMQVILEDSTSESRR